MDLLVVMELLSGNNIAAWHGTDAANKARSARPTLVDGDIKILPPRAPGGGTDRN